MAPVSGGQFFGGSTLPIAARSTPLETLVKPTSTGPNLVPNSTTEAIDAEAGEHEKEGAGQEKKDWESLPPLNRNAAGIDVGNAEHHVAVPLGRDAEPVQKFGSFTADLHRMAQWLKACGVDTVVMQATGVYWVALYQILEDYGLQVNVVNAQHTKTLPGRKSDVLESQWLQKLHTFGLLNNSFRPTEENRGCGSSMRTREG